MSDATQTLRLVSDPTRARILQLILESVDGRATVTRLAAALGLTQPTVSHHAKTLLDEGLLVREPVGREAWYSIPSEHTDQLTELLAPAASPDTADGALERITEDLAERFAGTFSRATVEAFVLGSHRLLTERSHITRHLPSLTAKFATDRLTATAHATRRTDTTPHVLFVCVQNAGRSQLAAGILRQLAGDRITVMTAGSEPAATIRSTVVAALDEIGVPIGGEYPKPLTDELVDAADIVVTMGCGDVVPVRDGKTYQDWDLQDPAGLPLSRVRQIRDDIDARVRVLLATFG